MPDELAPPSFPLASAAERLGTTTEAVRMRLRRGSLRGFKQGRQWFVYLPDDAGGDERTDQQPERPHATAQEPVTTGQRPDTDQQAQRIAWLEDLVMRQQVTIDSLTLAVNREQEVSLRAAGASRALPTPTAAAEHDTTHPTVTATPANAAAVPDTPVQLKALLKEAGVRGRKQRKRWAQRLAGILRG